MQGTARKTNKKKTPEINKQEHLASVVEHSYGEGGYSELNEEVRNVKDVENGIDLVRKYENLLKEIIKNYKYSRKTGQNRKTL